MKAKVALSIGSLALSWSTAAAPIYSTATGSYYDYVIHILPWSAARDAAESMSYLGISGKLATITSPQENDFIVNNLLNFGAGQESFWIGAYQPYGDIVLPAEGWEWITGEPWVYTNWYPGQPDDQASGGEREHCLEIFTTAMGGMWNDLGMNNRDLSSGFVVEYALVPEPSTFALAGLGVAALLIARRHK